MKNFTEFIVLVISFLLILGFSSNIYAQEIEFTGYGATGYIIYNRDILNGYNQETYFEGKLQAEIKINKKIEAQFDMRGNSTEESIALHEFSIKLKYLDKLNFKIGNIKRPFASEYLTSREKLITIERSSMQEQISELGYGVRTVSLMGYYNYSKKNPEYPYTYAFSIFRDNNLVAGFAGRFLYHSGPLSYGLNYMFQSKGGDEPIKTNGVGIETLLNVKDFESSLSLFYLQNPLEGVIQRLLENDDNITAFGAVWINAFEFDINGNFIDSIEPILLISYFMPNFDIKENHIIQLLTGANFYLTKDVRIRLNADLRMTKNEYNNNYSTNNSRGIFEIQAKF